MTHSRIENHNLREFICKINLLTIEIWKLSVIVIYIG